MLVRRCGTSNKVINLFEFECIQALAHLDFGKCTDDVNFMLSNFYNDNDNVNTLKSLKGDWHLYIMRNTNFNKPVYNGYYTDNYNTEVRYND